MNRIKCNTCQDVIESKHRHDYVACSCGRVAVDGGEDYLRRSFKEKGDYTELSFEKELKSKPPKPSDWIGRCDHCGQALEQGDLGGYCGTCLQLLSFDWGGES